MRWGTSLDVCIKLLGLGWKTHLSTAVSLNRPFPAFGRRGHYSNKPNTDHEYKGHTITTSKPLRSQLCTASQYTSFQNSAKGQSLKLKVNTVVQLEKIRVDLAQYKGEWNTFQFCVDFWAHSLCSLWSGREGHCWSILSVAHWFTTPSGLTCDCQNHTWTCLLQVSDWK